MAKKVMVMRMCCESEPLICPTVATLKVAAYFLFVFNPIIFCSVGNLDLGGIGKRVSEKLGFF